MYLAQQQMEQIPTRAWDSIPTQAQVQARGKELRSLQALCDQEQRCQRQEAGKARAERDKLSLEIHIDKFQRFHLEYTMSELLAKTKAANKKLIQRQSTTQGEEGNELKQQK